MKSLICSTGNGIETTIAFLIIVFLIIAFGVFCLIWSIRKAKHTNYLLENSLPLKKIDEINKKYTFFEIGSIDSLNHTYDNENFYDTISCKDYLIYQLQFDIRFFEKELHKIDHNKKSLALYKKELSLICDFGAFNDFPPKLNYNYLLKLEKSLFNQRILKAQTNFYVQVFLYCAKMNGDVYRKKHQNFSDADISAFLQRLKNKSGYFYNDREIWDAICRVERGKVSNKMRFAIYERDGYRCKICGRRGNHVALEIDHIKPIAKGGKSTYDNLQTLCKRCNQEKSDKWY